MTDFYRALVRAQVEITQLLTEHDTRLTLNERRTIRRMEEYLTAMVVHHEEERDGKGTPRRRVSET